MIRALLRPLLLICASAARATAPCQIVPHLDLPVVIEGLQPFVTARINGREVRFLLDSGASRSSLSRAAASELGLMTIAAPPRFHLRGVGGEAGAEIARVADFEVGGMKIAQPAFIVAGSVPGAAGLLGQDFLRPFDVEYDLPHGRVRLLKARHCPGVTGAYWAGDRPVRKVTLIPGQPHTVGLVTLDGVRLSAVFDTGAQVSILTAAAARRAGVTPQSAGVRPGGFAAGLGGRLLPTWLAHFGPLEIGGERIAAPRIRFAEVEIDTSDLLIGVDFFLTHRILVEAEAARMLITEEPGTGR